MSRDIYENSPMWHRMMKLHNMGLTPQEIASDSSIKKDRTTIMHHLRNAGVIPHLHKGAHHMPRGTMVKKVVILKKEVFGPGRCKDCGIKLAEMPNHNCAPGVYFKRNDMGGNGTGAELI